MKTTHRIARELLALPDVPLHIEGWCRMDNREMVAELTDYSDQEAILWQKPLHPLYEPVLDTRGVTWRWLNINPVVRHFSSTPPSKPGDDLPPQSPESGSPAPLSGG